MTRAQRIALEVVAVLCAAGLVAVVITWPLAANFDTYIVGGGAAGDNTGYLWDIWSSARYGLDLWGGGLQGHVGLPFGRTVIGGASLLLATYTVPASILASFLPTVVAYNVMVLAGMALSGASMYLLVRWLGLGILPAAWAGLAFQVFPYETLRIAAHPPLAWLMFAPILLMACIYWLQQPSWRRGVLLAAATLFAWLSNPYFGAMALVVVAVTVAVGALLVMRSQGARAMAARMGEAVAALGVIVILPLAIIISATRGVAEQIVTRQEIELSLYGARLSDYVFPAPGQYLWSGILGSDSSSWPFASPGGERTAFIGWTVLIIAVAGLALAWRMRASLGPRLRVTLALVIPGGLMMALFSLASPYPIFGREIPMPSSLVFDYLPFLRVYARFSLFVMACLLVVGAIGLWLLMRNRSITWRAGVASTAIILTAMELPVSLPVGTGVPLLIEGAQPAEIPTWQWLAKNDRDAVVIETPALPNEILDRQFLYGQLVHGHPLANGGLNEPGAATDFGREYGDPMLPGAARAYATTGIKYVVVNPWAWRQAGMDPPDGDSPPPGFTGVRAFGDGSAIWRVTAAPAKAIAFPATGWWDPETIDGVRWRYMKDEATMTAYAPRATKARVRFNVEGFRPGAAYALAIDDPAGTTRRVPIRGARTVAFTTMLPAGRSTFRLTTSGSAPAQISATDLRIVTIRVSQWTIT